MYANPLNPGPNAAPPYVQPNTSTPTVNKNVANYPVGKNPLNINGVRKFWQPGGTSFGHTSPNAVVLACPIDGAAMQICGSSDFVYKCPNCGHQFRSDGTMLQPDVFFPAPLVVPPNPPRFSFAFPDNSLPPVTWNDAGPPVDFDNE